MTSLSLTDLLADLAAETGVVADLLEELRPAEWELPTPAAGWAIRDQVSHLAFFDDAAVLAASNPDAFRTEAADLMALGPGFPDRVAERYRHLGSEELLDWFRIARAELLTAFAVLDGRARVPWFGPDMSVTSSATARLMETWAHGQDIADALGVTYPATERLRHIAHLGVRTYGFSFSLNGRPVPDVPVRVELTSPGNERWAWGDPAAGNTVTGPALDFCLLVTQRRHLADTELVVTDRAASEWMSIAQAFAGAPGTGREPVTLAVREVS